MNPLTLVKRIQKINSTEASLGVSEEASWHSKYKESAYIFVGGIPFDLTEGDLLAVFSQYGEVVDVNLVRDKGTGKSKGFAFLAYEDQRSTILAVDNLNGANLLGRIVRVDHVSNYKKKEEEDEEKERQKREARGVCRAFQKGECNRGAACKFSHDEQRSANTGWGPKDVMSRWDHDKYEAPKDNKKPAYASDHILGSRVDERGSKLRSDIKDEGRSSAKVDDGDRKSKEILKDHDRRGFKKQPEWQVEANSREGQDRQMNEKWSKRHDSDPSSKEDRDRRESGKRLRYDEDKTQQYPKEGKHGRGNEKSSGMYETEKSQKEEWSRRRSEKYSRNERDETEHNPKEDMDRGGSERCSRYDMDDAEPNSKEDRGRQRSEKLSKYSSSHHRGEEDESPRKRVEANTRKRHCISKLS
ncbi:hypothetical protein MRB53_006237 [Persea americana]|uniref:Uncharacterized protein n=1 Tax=Persea americana TaxID=3435 RepID=A0ACC2MGL0_PERAE|nr:hypothetical protein MRB53_006237 [Persea americana]